MSRRDRLRVSLFPFMSVLACTIGSLVMLLITMSITAVGASRSSALAYAATKESVEADRQATRRETARLERAESLWKEVDAALEARSLAPGLSVSSIARELAGARRRQALARSLAELEEVRRELDDDRNSIETTIAVLQSRRETLPVLIDPTGLSRHLEPFFVECDAGGATAYRASDGFRYFVSKDELSSSGDFGRYLRRVQAYPGALLVLLVRPDGIDTTALTARIARNAGIRVARLPVPGQGELDWSLLRRAEGGR